MTRNTFRAASPAATSPAVPEGIPPAPPVGGARTFAEMEELARRHAGITAAPQLAPAMEPPAAPAPVQEASTDE